MKEGGSLLQICTTAMMIVLAARWALDDQFPLPTVS